MFLNNEPKACSDLSYDTFFFCSLSCFHPWSLVIYVFQFFNICSVVTSFIAIPFVVLLHVLSRHVWCFVVNCCLAIHFVSLCVVFCCHLSSCHLLSCCIFCFTMCVVLLLFVVKSFHLFSCHLFRFLLSCVAFAVICCHLLSSHVLSFFLSRNLICVFVIRWFMEFERTEKAVWSMELLIWNLRQSQLNAVFSQFIIAC